MTDLYALTQNITKQSLQTILLASVILFISSAAIYILYHASARLSPHVQYIDPTHQPLIGSLKHINNNLYRIHDRMLDISRLIGDSKTWTYSIPLHPPIIVLGTNPDLARHILNNLLIYKKGTV